MPRVSLIDVNIDLIIGPPIVDLISYGPCYGPPQGVLEIGPQFKAGANEATAAASFTVINTGNVDGFTTVEMVAQREVISSNRYFVAAGARQIKSLIAPNLHCSMSFDEISIRVGTIEPA